MTTDEFVKTKRPRGCRGRASKRRSREKWLAKIGAAYAHHGEQKHCGLDATSCAGRSAHRVTETSGAAAEELWSGTTRVEAKRQGIAPRPPECAASALLGAAGDAHQEKDAATKVAVMLGDAAVGQRGDSIPSTPTENRDGGYGEADGIATRTVPTVVVAALVVLWASGWSVTTGQSLVVAAVLSLWLDRQLRQWHGSGWAHFVPVAAMQGIRAKKRMATKRRIKQSWTRVFDIMIERGMAGELAQCRLANKRLQSELTEAQEFVTKTLLYRQYKENDRIQSLENTVGRLMDEKRQLEQALEQQVERFEAEAQKTVAKELQELKGKALALEEENIRLVGQMHGLGQCTVDAEKALAEAKLKLKSMEKPEPGDVGALKSVESKVELELKPSLSEQVAKILQGKC